MKVCVFGASGYVGSAIHAKLKTKADIKVVGTSLEESSFQDVKQLDVNDPESFSRFYKEEKPDLVIWSLMAGPSEYKLSNQGLIHLMTFLTPSTKLIYISSDYVFSQGRGPYLEDDPLSVLPDDHALGNYANAKVKAEKFIQKELSNYLILRAGPVYGKSCIGKCDEHSIQLERALSQNRSVRFRDDIIRTFVHVNDLVDVVDELLVTKTTGVLHIGPKEPESYYQFMKRRAIEKGYDPSLVELDETKKIQMNMPKNTALITEKLHHVARTKIR